MNKLIRNLKNAQRENIVIILLTFLALLFLRFEAPIDQVKGVFSLTELTDKIFFSQVFETIFAVIFLYVLSLPFIKDRGIFEGIIIGYLVVSATVSVLWIIGNVEISQIFWLFAIIAIFNLISACVIWNYNAFLFKFGKLDQWQVLIIAISVILIAVHCALGDESTRLFAGYPIDRFSYVILSIETMKHGFAYISHAHSEGGHSGIISAALADPLLPKTQYVYERIGVNLLYPIFFFPVKDQLYAYSNGFVSFLRIIQFFSIVAFLQSAVPQKPRLTIIIGLCIVFGYWFIYLKDYDAWSAQAAMPMIIYLLSLLGRKLSWDISYERGWQLEWKIVLCVACLTAFYIEGTAWWLFGAGIAFAMVAITQGYSFIQQRHNLFNLVLITFIEVICGIILSVLINPFVIKLAAKEYLRGHYDEVSFEIVKQLASLLSPYALAREQQLELLKAGFAATFMNFRHLIDYAYGSLGFYFLTWMPSVVLLAILILSLLLARKCSILFLPSTRNRSFFFVILGAVYIAMHIVPFAFNKITAFGHSAYYAFCITTIIFGIFLLRCWDKKITRYIITLPCCLMWLGFGFSTAVALYENKYEDFSPHYEFSRDLNLFEKWGRRARNNIDFNFHEVDKLVQSCTSVYVDVANTLMDQNIEMTLLNMGIPYSSSYGTYSTGDTTGDPSGPATAVREKFDCEINDAAHSRDGRKTYELINLRECWSNQEISRSCFAREGVARKFGHEAYTR